MATKGKKISEVALENKLTELDGSELVPLAKNGSNAVADTDTIKEFAQDGLDDKYVAKEDGKGLSTNDFTDEYKAKLDRFELVLANDDEIEDGLHQIASSEDYRSKLKENGYVVYHDVKYKVKDCGVNSDSFPWIITEGAVITANEEGELNDHTQKNVVRSVYIWFDTILHYQPYGSIIPSKVSELQNDLKYQTEAQLSNSLAILYESLDSQLVDEYTHLDNKKVDKVAGKQLSTEDFTTLLKQKLEGLTNYDDTALTTALNTLKGRLDTLVGSDDATAVIDTFQEIEAFLQGVTNTQTLTGLLQEMKSEIVALCASTYIAKPSNGTSSQFLKADGSVDSTAYLPTTGGTVSNANAESFIIKRLAKAGAYTVYKNNEGLLGSIGITGSDSTRPHTLMYEDKDNVSYKLWHEGNDGAGSGLDADLLDGVDGSSYFKTVVLQPADLDADNLNTVNTNYVPNSDLNSEQWKTKTLTNFPNPAILTPSVIAGGFSLRVIREGERKKQIFSYYGSNNAVYIRTYYYANGSRWTPWVKLALTTDNVASADKLTTKQLTNEDLNTLQTPYSVFYARNDNTCINKPANIERFSLQVIDTGQGGIAQILIAADDKMYIRGITSSEWTAWKQLATTNDPAPALKTNIIANVDLNDIKDTDYKVYWCYDSSNVSNRPTQGGGTLICFKGGSTAINQIWITPTNQIYLRSYSDKWCAWKKMLTEDDITSLVSRIEALEARPTIASVASLPSNPDSDTLYVIPE